MVLASLPVTLPVASLTEPIVDAATDFIDAVGAFGVFVLMTLESACIPVPSEAIMLFAGFNVSQGEMTLLDKNRFIHINRRHLEWADRWFERHGDVTVFVCRILPIVRTFISLPAGVAKMPCWRFTVLTLLGCIPWVLMLGVIGREVGDRWEEWRNYLEYFDYAVAAAIVIGVVYLLIRRRRGAQAAEAG